MYNDLSDYEEGDFYINKDGYKVFTEQYLLKGGIVVKTAVNIALMASIKKLAE